MGALRPEQKISIIVPCYNEEESLPIFYREVTDVMSSMGNEYELLFINDGSNDGTAAVLKKLADEDPRVFYISFSRNFGKEAAMLAGLKNASGQYAAVMDADMQDPPSLLPRMAEIIAGGEYDCVATRRVDRKGEPPVRSWFARRFYRLINKVSDTEIVDGARDFRLMDRRMVDAVISMGEYSRFSKGIFGWVGFRTYWLPYENKERAAGKTKWDFWKLLSYALGGIIDFSTLPLSLSVWFGIGVSLLSFVMIIFIIIRKLLFGDPVSGWASTICVILFIGGVQTFCIGILGQYLARTYMESKRRPHYIVAERKLPEGSDASNSVAG